MRIKKAPLRASGMEGSKSCSPMVEAPVTTSLKMDHSLDYQTCPVKIRQGRARNDRKELAAAQRDEETQAAKAKLRQYEALGHIKVEMDESNEDTVDTQPLDDAPATLVALSAATLAQEGGCSLPQVSLTSGQTQLIMNTSHPVQPRVGGMVDVPTLSDMQGKYGFTVSVDDKERSTKSPMWMMSTIVNKLYTNLNKAVPFEVRLKNSPSDEKLFIRAVLVFSSPEFLRTNVNRCPNHTSNTEATNHGKH
ncbi:Cellular tumor antigen p53 [Chionoecetes opilio]|uniref:Cellular tumor antigen p53 n=1 Tax=Chionoecetes opilio TaxID=41210 RepID=A0A8J5CU54_CHIOP|nr:Cellular tumor antigen p53 [Chionoecetes opilio]